MPTGLRSRCGADDRQALELLCRYITRPALANERVQTVEERNNCDFERKLCDLNE